jgi:hypothetical protein
VKLAMFALISMFLFASLAYSQGSVTKSTDLPKKAFYSSQISKIVTIESVNKERITLEIPQGMFLSIYCSASPTKRAEDHTPLEFQGAISVRTKPASAIIDGQPMEEQMAATPLRIDLDDAKVSVEIKK